MDDTKRIALVETKTVDNGAVVNNPAPAIRYQLGNQIESASLELDETANIVSYEEYYPYGDTSYQAGRSIAEVGLKRYRYTGKEKDEESGLYYHGARYYACWLGRWTAADPAGMVDGVNLYMYCRGNPVVFMDPEGTQVEENGVENRTQENYNTLNSYLNYREKWFYDFYNTAEGYYESNEDKNSIQRISVSQEKIKIIQKHGWDKKRTCFELARDAVFEATKKIPGAIFYEEEDRLTSGNWEQILQFKRKGFNITQSGYDAMEEEFKNWMPDIEANEDINNYIKMSLDEGLPVLIGVNSGYVPAKESENYKGTYILTNKESMVNHYLVLTSYSMQDGKIIGFQGIDNASSEAPFVDFVIDENTKEMIKEKYTTGVDNIDRVEYKIIEVRIWKKHRDQVKIKQ